MQDALLDQFFWARAMRDLLVQTVLPHVLLQLHLLTLDRRGSGRLREDVAWEGIISKSTYEDGAARGKHTLDELLAPGSVLKALPQTVGGSLPLQLVSCGLEGSRTESQLSPARCR